MKILCNILGVLTLAILTVSCNHKELCYEHEHNSKIRVVYDWSDAPEASPAGMCVFFYSVDNPEKYYRFDFANTTGGEIEIPAGNYVLITYNNDTELVRFSKTNLFDGHTATTREGDLLEPLYGNGVTSTATTDNGERVMICPDALWGCHATDVSITEHGVTYTFTHFDDTRAGETVTKNNAEDQVITLYPHDMLCHYSYEVRHVENGEHISNVSGSLSGMSGQMNLSDESLDAEPVTLPVSGATAAGNRQITGSFLTFGHKTGNDASHNMAFYIVMDDGSKYVVKNSPNLDVTQQVDTAADRRHVHIIIDRITLPHPGEPQDGWNPTVDDWGVLNEEIRL